MTTRDEPPTDEPTQPEIEEISDDLIIAPGETLPGAVRAPGAEPSEVAITASEVAIPAKAAPQPEPEPEPRREPAPAARREPSRPGERRTPERPIARAAEAPVARPRTEERLDEASTRVVIVPRESAPRSRFPLLIALVFLFCGFGAGFFAGQLWERQSRAAAPPPAAPAAAPVAEADAERPEATAGEQRPATPPPKRTAKPAKAAPAKAASAKPAPAPAASSTARAKLDVTAPAGAEVYLDGKRIGRGSTHTTVTPGRHRIEVRVGKNRVSESFDAEPGGTWTYDVTPSK